MVCFVPKLLYVRDLKMAMAAVLGLALKMVSNLQNSHFIRFVITKIVESDITIMFMHLYPLLGFKVIVFQIFQYCDDGHLGFRGPDDFKFKK